MYNIATILTEAATKGIEVSVYRWKQPKQYRRGIHTDSIAYVGGTLTGLDSIDEYVITSACIMDAEELNHTIYANCSEVTDVDEYIVMVEEKPEPQE